MHGLKMPSLKGCTGVGKREVVPGSYGCGYTEGHSSNELGPSTHKPTLQEVLRHGHMKPQTFKPKSEIRRPTPLNPKPPHLVLEHRQPGSTMPLSTSKRPTSFGRLVV